MMTAVWVGVYILVGLIVGGATYAIAVDDKARPSGEEKCGIAGAVILWPLMAGGGMAYGFGLLLYKGAEWIGDWIWVLTQVRKGGKG